MKQKYGRDKIPCYEKEKGNRRQKGKGCVSQGKGKKMSGSFPVPVRPACPANIGSMRLHINIPELKQSFLTTKGHLINTA